MKIVEKHLAPPITIEIDRRRNLVAGGECEACMTVGQRFKAIVAIGEFQIGAVHINMSLDRCGDQIGENRKSTPEVCFLPSASRFPEI